MKRKLFIVFTVLLLSISIVGCGNSDMEGIILEVTENELLLSKNLSLDKYEDMKNKSISEIQEEEKGIFLIYLTHDNTKEWSKGDEVKVWIDGDILTSYPEQAKAKKIQFKK
ncbi:DUF3221 domain-containing protein [Gracilibacillus kekensis]|uniref:DUF3221 domain-containing protein n=1 Tax=Gracilibacillus kekensis TaxID=1027249 RepID=A0A1M7PM09_9BACI|nr:DUF3221 domain-containing protein [Gracilibacillus kekensis]SHN18261.1 Protein of unknown function [Gracilibacillus kekensis]